MVFQLLLIRHAQSANNALPVFQRVSDPGLTDVGIGQAAALAEWLRLVRPTQLYCSGFRRALETVKPIAGKLALRPAVRADLFEQGGCYSGYRTDDRKPASGMGNREIRERFGDWSIDERIGEEGWYHGRTLESDEEAMARAERVAAWIEDELLSGAKGASESLRPALIIHADFKALLLAALLRRDPSKVLHYLRARERFEYWNTSITELTWSRNHWEVARWNTVDHLSPEERTC